MNIIELPPCKKIHMLNTSNFFIFCYNNNKWQEFDRIKNSHVGYSEARSALHGCGNLLRDSGHGVWERRNDGVLSLWYLTYAQLMNNQQKLVSLFCQYVIKSVWVTIYLEVLINNIFVRLGKTLHYKRDHDILNIILIII
jgi:hypothetical protein